MKDLLYWISAIAEVLGVLLAGLEIRDSNSRIEAYLRGDGATTFASALGVLNFAGTATPGNSTMAGDPPNLEQRVTTLEQWRQGVEPATVALVAHETALVSKRGDVQAETNRLQADHDNKRLEKALGVERKRPWQGMASLWFLSGGIVLGLIANLWS